MQEKAIFGLYKFSYETFYRLFVATPLFAKKNMLKPSCGGAAKQERKSPNQQQQAIASTNIRMERHVPRRVRGGYEPRLKKQKTSIKIRKKR